MLTQSCCIFLGAATPTNKAFINAAKAIGPLLKKYQINLVYGGAQRGLMGMLADSAIQAGVHTTGVMSDDLQEIEITHPKLDKLYKTTTINLRKETMIALSDFFIALPGGIGTLEEIFTTWCHLKIHKQQKKIGLLNIDNFFAPLKTSIEKMEEESFITAKDKTLVSCESDAETLIAALMQR
jgi:uncharacterized protein (TIGR00730 family)